MSFSYGQAFQTNAFQRNAFQQFRAVPPPPIEGGGGPGRAGQLSAQARYHRRHERYMAHLNAIVKAAIPILAKQSDGDFFLEIESTTVDDRSKPQ